MQTKVCVSVSELSEAKRSLNKQSDVRFLQAKQSLISAVIG